MELQGYNYHLHIWASFSKLPMFVQRTVLLLTFLASNNYYYLAFLEKFCQIALYFTLGTGWISLIKMEICQSVKIGNWYWEEEKKRWLSTDYVFRQIIFQTEYSKISRCKLKHLFQKNKSVLVFQVSISTQTFSSVGKRKVIDWWFSIHN